MPQQRSCSAAAPQRHLRELRHPGRQRRHLGVRRVCYAAGLVLVLLTATLHLSTATAYMASLPVILHSGSGCPHRHHTVAGSNTSIMQPAACI